MSEVSPGILPALPKALYHADPCPTPSLSSHIANTLLKQSPRHARRDHQRLNPNYKSKTKKQFDIGTVAHGLMLGDPECVTKIVDAKAWTTKAAKAARAQAYENGQVPLLKKQADKLFEMVNEGQLQLLQSDAAGAFSDGLPEQTLVWTEETNHGVIWCRCRLDWFPQSGSVFYDYKTTAGSAHPDAFYASAWENGYYLQQAFYMRGIRKATGRDVREFRFVVQEVEDPYALSICSLTPAGLAEADDCVDEAIDLWGWCVHNNKWPGYSGHVAYVDAPVWAVRRREEKKLRNHHLQISGIDPKKAMIDWYRPL